MQLSETVVSKIASTIGITRDASAGGTPIRAFWDDFDYSGTKRTVIPTVTGTVVQTFAFGSNGRPITIHIPWCPAALWDALKTNRDSTSTTAISVELATKYAPDGSPDTFTYASCVWLDLTCADKRRVGSWRLLRDVTLELISVA